MSKQELQNRMKKINTTRRWSFEMEEISCNHAHIRFIIWGY